MASPEILSLISGPLHFSLPYLSLRYLHLLHRLPQTVALNSHSRSFVLLSFTILLRNATQAPVLNTQRTLCRDHSASHRARSSENNLLICSLRPPRQLPPPAYSPRCSKDNLPPHSHLYSWINKLSDRRERVLGRATFM